MLAPNCCDPRNRRDRARTAATTTGLKRRQFAASGDICQLSGRPFAHAAHTSALDPGRSVFAAGELESLLDLFDAC
jgi:hypothetical protein